MRPSKPASEDEESVDVLRAKLDEVLRLSREQMTATTEMRKRVQEIHHRIIAGGFPILPNEPNNGGGGR
jgi:hypothetical protein